MTIKQFWALVLIALILAAALVLFSPRAALAEECPLPLHVAIDQIEDAGGTLIKLVGVPAVHTDQLLIYTLDGNVLVLPSKAGCVVNYALWIDEAKPTTPA